MSVIEVAAFSLTDPNGTPLGTVTDAQAELAVRVGYKGDPGSLAIRINRHHSAAALVRENLIYKVKIPQIQSSYLPVGFIASDKGIRLLDPNEKGAEYLELKGVGLKGMLSRARLLWNVFAPGQPDRGSDDHAHNLWWWINEPYGAIATRVLEEGINQPGSPLADFTLTFDRVEDTDGVPWANIAEEWQTQVGTDVLSVVQQMEQHGDFYLEVTKDLVVNAYQSYSGRDLTGSVHFQAPGAILTAVDRKANAEPAITHLLLEDSEGNYSQEVMPGFSGRANWGYFKASTNDDTTLNKIAQEVIRASRSALEPVQLGIKPTVYLAGPAGSSGSFWTSDTVLMSTDPGIANQDYDESEVLVTGIRFSTTPAVKDDTSDHAKRSLLQVVECNVEQVQGVDPKSGFGNPMPPHSHLDDLCAEGLSCEELTAADLDDQTTTNGDAEDTGGSQFSGGGYSTAQRHAGTRSYAVTSADATLTYTFSGTFSAGIRYVVDVWNRRNGSHIDSDMKFGVSGTDEEVMIGLTASDFITNETGADGDDWGLYRICWTPQVDRTGVRVSLRNRQSSSEYFGIDDVQLYTAPADEGITGVSRKKARCDHGHRHNDTIGRASPDAHPATAVSFDPTGTGTSETDVQGALVDALAASGYSDEQAQDAVGGMLVDSSTIDFTYTDATPALTAVVLPAGIKLDDLGTPDDNTDLNATTGQHGLLRKLSNVATEYLDGTGAWSEPEAGTGGVLPWVILPPWGMSSRTTSGLGANNRMVFWPVVVPKACTITGIRLRVGSSNGTTCVAMYSEDGATRIATSGSVGTPAPGLATISFSSGAVVAAGRYWFALSASVTSASFNRADDGSTATPALAKFMDSSHPCPSALTLPNTDTVVAPNAVGIISGISNYP